MAARVYLSPPHMGPDERGLLLEAFDSNWIAPLGPHVDGFEKELAARVQVPHAAALSSGTAALHLSLQLLGVGRGDEVLVSSLTFAASALMYAGIAAVAAQLGSDARSASSIAIAVLGVSYVARGYLDSTGAEEWTRWLTPLGWLEQTYPATQNNLWPLVPAVLLAIAMVALALGLQRRRDFGLGLIAKRHGGMQIANPIYREIIVRSLTDAMRASIPKFAPTWLRADGTLPDDRTVRFDLAGTQPDMWWVNLSADVYYWQTFAPGTARSFVFPDISRVMGLSDLPQGQPLYMNVTGFRTPGFNYNDLRYQWLSQFNWTAYAARTLLFSR